MVLCLLSARTAAGGGARTRSTDLFTTMLSAGVAPRAVASLRRPESGIEFTSPVELACVCAARIASRVLSLRGRVSGGRNGGRAGRTR